MSMNLMLLLTPTPSTPRCCCVLGLPALGTCARRGPLTPHRDLRAVSCLLPLILNTNLGGGSSRAIIEAARRAEGVTEGFRARNSRMQVCMHVYSRGYCCAEQGPRGLQALDPVIPARAPCDRHDHSSHAVREERSTKVSALHTVAQPEGWSWVSAAALCVQSPRFVASPTVPPM